MADTLTLEQDIEVHLGIGTVDLVPGVAVRWTVGSITVEQPLDGPWMDEHRNLTSEAMVDELAMRLRMALAEARNFPGPRKIFSQ
jgi:hypothetical protein